MITQETIEKNVIGKRVVAVAWVPSLDGDRVFAVNSITLEGGTVLDFKGSYYEAVYVRLKEAKIVSSDDDQKAGFELVTCGPWDAYPDLRPRGVMGRYEETDMPLEHFHVLTCPYCYTEAECVSCSLSDCHFPHESKKEFPLARKIRCLHCGETFWGCLGNFPLETELNLIQEETDHADA